MELLSGDITHACCRSGLQSCLSITSFSNEKGKRVIFNMLTCRLWTSCEWLCIHVIQNENSRELKIRNLWWKMCLFALRNDSAVVVNWSCFIILPKTHRKNADFQLLAGVSQWLLYLFDWFETCLQRWLAFFKAALNLWADFSFTASTCSAMINPHARGLYWTAGVSSQAGLKCKDTAKPAWTETSTVWCWLWVPGDRPPLQS